MAYQINQKARNALKRLAELPGMHQVKEQVEQMVQLARVAKLREQHGLKMSPQSLHMLFTGNPGTGKTTAARLIGEAFAAIGLLKSNRDSIPFIEIHHSDITHPHVGQAERTIKSKFDAARGGVLFIDEAYAFIGVESSHNSGDKVIAAIVQLMEDMRDQILVIAAGYPKDMMEFINSNPGLRSRFSNTTHFPDYSVSELVQIGQKMAAEQDFQVAPDYIEALSSVLWVEKSKKHFGNARTVRNHLERSIRQQAVRMGRLSNVRRNDLTSLIAADLVHSASGLAATEKEALKKIIDEAQTRLSKLEIQEFLYGQSKD